MRTFTELMNLKNVPNKYFKSNYEAMMMALEDYYISKLDGIERIKGELQEWDKESRRVIVGELITRINESGMLDFDEKELLILI